MAHRSEDVRNAALVGAGGAGKTTLVESLLFLTKDSGRKGSIAEKNTVCDWDDDEKDRQHTILSTPVRVHWENKHVNLIDTPGALDFIGEPMAALAAVEMAVVCVNAHDGVGVATRKLFRAARDMGMPCCIAVTRIESENVDGDALLDSIQEAFGERAVPLNLPDAFGPAAKEVIDVFGKDVPEHLADKIARYRTQATERVVEVDEELTMKYLDEGDVTQEELESTFPRALRAGNIVPVLHVSAELGVGMRKFLTFLVHDSPAPKPHILRKAVDAEGEPVVLDADGPFSAQVWKIQVDPHVGKLAYLRVWTGSLSSKTQFTVRRTGEEERIGDLLQIQGKEMKPIASAAAGDIVAVAKVDDLRIGDTVGDATANWTFVPVKTPYPKVTLAIHPKNRADETKLGPELQKLDESDPTFIAEREEGTNEMVVRGMSSLHIDIMLKRLARKKVEAVTSQPRVPYRETIAGAAQSSYRHKKQSGGRGQFAEVHLKVAPLERGGDFEFVDEVVGGSIPRQFIPAVEKGVRETLPRGVVAGCPFTDVKVTVFFGKAHDVDSDEHSFKLASSQAFRIAVNDAKPVLLEPVMEVTIEVPSRFMGDISGDLNSRRGRILGMNQEGDLAIIQAHVPLAEMMQYSTELRSLTAGEGDYDFHFSGYEPVPAHVAEGIIARHKKEAESE